MADPALVLRSVVKRYRQAGEPLDVLNGVDLTIHAGEIVALVGPSGAGKSTLLQIAGLLDRADSGEVLVAGEPCGRLSDDRRSEMRRSLLGFVFQFHHLLPEFSAVENVMLPQLIMGLRRSEARLRALELLDMVGLGERATHRPSELSGGEQQRVAIARAVANAPQILLADEPTGNLDAATAGRVMDQLVRLVHGTGVAALVATHNMEHARRMDRIVQLVDGHLSEAG